MKKAIILLCVVLSISIIYQFIVRPIQKDKKLDSCLDSIWIVSGGDDELFKMKSEGCYKEFK